MEIQHKSIVLKAIKNFIIYLVLLVVSLNITVFLQSLWNNGEVIKEVKVSGIFYSGLIFISFLLTALLSFYFFIRAIFCILQITKSAFVILTGKNEQLKK